MLLSASFAVSVQVVGVPGPPEMVMRCRASRTLGVVDVRVAVPGPLIVMLYPLGVWVIVVAVPVGFQLKNVSLVPASAKGRLIGGGAVVPSPQHVTPAQICIFAIAISHMLNVPAMILFDVLLYGVGTMTSVPPPVTVEKNVVEERGAVPKFGCAK